MSTMKCVERHERFWIGNLLAGKGIEHMCLIYQFTFSLLDHGNEHLKKVTRKTIKLLDSKECFINTFSGQDFVLKKKLTKRFKCW